MEPIEVIGKGGGVSYQWINQVLILSRHRGESIMIGDEVKITIVDIRGDKIRVGIEAPRDIGVHRMEVYDKIKENAEEIPNARPDVSKPGE